MVRNRKKPQYARVYAFLRKRLFLFGFLGLFVLSLVALTVFTVYLLVIYKGLPSPDQFSARLVSESTKLYDRTGKILLYEIHGDEKRTVVPFDQIPDAMKEAALSAEDANFYNEPAFDWRAILRALWVDLKSGQIVQGGSTITQQLAKNVFLSSERTWSRKLKELVLAIELESRYSKDQVLGFYLNQIPFGSNAYGVEAASQTFFGKNAKNLSLNEAAALAGLIRAPSYYSPWGNHLDELVRRKNDVLDRMAQLGHISQEDAAAAKKEELIFLPPSIGNIRAPHFSLAVKDHLINRYGEDTVLNGGLKVTTTLDWDMQQAAEKAVSDGAERNEELYQAKNAALVAQDPKTGQVLALVGSRDYFDVSIDGNFNVPTQGLRQPGSALKPFVYMNAFEKGYSPKTMIFDVPTEFVPNNPRCPQPPEYSKPTNLQSPCFHPQNFDGIFRGPLNLESALAQSVNIPAVKILYLAGLENVLKNIHAFGITTLNETWRYGLSLTLGGGEVKLIDLVNAYATLSQEGVHHDQSLILEVADQSGKTLEKYHDEANRVIEPAYPRLINQVLSDADLRAPLYQAGLGLTLFENHDVALKTGTTNDYRDAWAMGYTPSLVVGVWAGNNDNAPMQRRGSSILAAVPIWNAFLKQVLQKYPTETFPRPELVNLPAKPMLNGQYLVNAIYMGGAYPQIHSLLYYVDPRDPLGPVPAYIDDPQFQNWEKGVLDWARTNIPGFLGYNQPVPGDSFSVGTALPQSDIVFFNVSPAGGSFLSPPLYIKADIYSAKGLRTVELFFNRSVVVSFGVSGNAYALAYQLNAGLGPQNLIEIKVTDVSGEISVRPIIVYH
ncbi:MAG: Penicillin-binding protein, 1A family [Candidatus Jorgensenbacteria bacterium GW2011_GWA1_48_11]|uniref:Penicillin-binding protein, 1A family n=1 Tax=Candidatus Jorgensenbacteria bacterium GW2011_GWA1_48_11 TaxID=1618660 RepID=A0A0G1XB65_9BACT|nr:MAG: Penicillin-binding protein, 1A family [Candidatus Jorgensenbacteria bacterium GW2011_GWA1_48_11]KKW12058.1 MAG: Penicillin-binding protein, 1A family [Candidatus Jorgensenbacteria bacterium GW2011_GWB1_49_9]